MAKSKQVLALASLNVGQRRTVTPNQSRIMQNMAAVGHAWSNLSPADRAPWQLLANQMNHDTGLRTAAGLKQKRPMTAFQAFSALNGTLLACGQEINTVAPASVTKPYALPPLMLTATSTMSDAVGTLPFTLTITAPAYQDTLQIYAAPPLLAGQYPAARNAVLITTLGSLVSGANDLAPAYQAKFGPLQPGQQVVLTLVPVSDEGFKGVPLTITADVNAPAAATAKRGSDKDRALKAA